MQFQENCKQSNLVANRDGSFQCFFRAKISQNTKVSSRSNLLATVLGISIV